MLLTAGGVLTGMTMLSHRLDTAVVLQPGPGPGFEGAPAVDPSVGLGGGAVGAFVYGLLALVALVITIA